jgi:type II secretory pathway pseudopilin PulG
VLSENLRIVRETIDKFYGDKGRYPESLDELVSERYLRALPHDPITGSSEHLDDHCARGARRARERSTTSRAAPRHHPRRQALCRPLAMPTPAHASARHRRRLQAGFTYLGLLILVAILALATSATLTLGSIVQRREAEQRLLEVGAAYRQAIASYLNSSPAGDRSYPGSLADLLKDPRYPGVRRHLRQLYPDPITGKAEWGLVPAPGGGIMGDPQPLRRARRSRSPGSKAIRRRR